MEQAGLRGTALQEIGKLCSPDWGRARIEGMVKGRPDWCISRQRTWGVPTIALFIPRAVEISSGDTTADRGGGRACGKAGIEHGFRSIPRSCWVRILSITKSFGYA